MSKTHDPQNHDVREQKDRQHGERDVMPDKTTHDTAGDISDNHSGDTQGQAPSPPVSRPPGAKSGKTRLWLAAGALVIAILAAMILGAWLRGRYGDLGFSFLSARHTRLDAVERTAGQNSETLQFVSKQLTATGNRLDSDERHIAATEKTIAALEGKIETDRHDIAKTSRAIGELQKSLQDTQAPSQPAETDSAATDSTMVANELGLLSRRIDELRGTIEALTLKQDARNEKTARMIGALNALRQAAGEGRPFMHEFQTLLRLVPDIERFTALRDYGAQGVETSASLGEAFASVAKDFAQPATPVAAKSGGNWWDGIKSRLFSLVTVERRDRTVWRDTMRRMTPLILAGDLASAVNLADSVEDRPPARLKAWLDRAHARFAVDRALNALPTVVFETLFTLDSAEG
ncbi:MAG: hypothetical protein V6Z86_07905 [Hyphomicrobiales bacterium]